LAQTEALANSLAAIRVQPDTSRQPQAKARARVAHGRHLKHQFPAGLWLADTDEIAREKVWEKNYTISIPTKEIDMLPSSDIDAYTDGSLVGGRSGAGAYILKKTDGRRTHICSLRGNTKQATVFQSEVMAVKAAAEAIFTNEPSGQLIVFHVDNQATLKTLDSTNITNKSCKDTRDSLNVLGRNNTVILDWVKAHVVILGNEEADKLAKTGGNSTSVLGSGLTVKSTIKKELREYLLSEWTKRWQSTADYRLTKVWYPASDMPKSKQLMKHTRPTVGRRNLSEWNLSEGIFQKIFSAKPESFRMESFKRNLSGTSF
jgi:ribonuclease HI